MKPNFNSMTKSELKAYVLAHRDDDEAFQALISRRSPDETATWYSSENLEEMQEIFKRRINGELSEYKRE